MSWRVRSSSTVRGLIDFVALAATVLIAWYLWPAFLGGSTRFIIVAGHSMEPTYPPGELVLLDDDGTPEIGDTVVFQIPAGQPASGLMVIHRIIGQRSDGTYITQGDNRATADGFEITRSDILGTPRLAIPHFGTVVGFLRTPMAVGAATGLLVMILLWPRKREESPEVIADVATEDDRPVEPHSLADQSDVADVEPLSAPAEDVMAGAHQWLVELLQSTGQLVG